MLKDGPLFIDVRDASPPAKAVAQAVTALRAGEVVVMPTDTVYGVGVSPEVSGATARLFSLKGRSFDSPLAVLCADAGQALSLAESPSEAVRRVAESLWPGPLTLVLRRRADLTYELGAPSTTIGVRCPDHALVRAIAAKVGPVATSSANPHGQPTPRTAAGVIKELGGRVAVVLDGGPCDGAPSTVIDVTTHRLRVLRQGALSLAAVERLWR